MSLFVCDLQTADVEHIETERSAEATVTSANELVSPAPCGASVCTYERDTVVRLCLCLLGFFFCFGLGFFVFRLCL